MSTDYRWLISTYIDPLQAKTKALRTTVQKPHAISWALSALGIRWAHGMLNQFCFNHARKLDAVSYALWRGVVEGNTERSVGFLGDACYRPIADLARIIRQHNNGWSSFDPVHGLPELAAAEILTHPSLVRIASTKDSIDLQIGQDLWFEYAHRVGDLAHRNKEVRKTS